MNDIKIHCKERIIETGQVFEIDDERKAKYAELLKSLDDKWGITILGNSLNNYGFSDYLVVGAMIQSIRNIHRTTYYNHMKKNGSTVIQRFLIYTWYLLKNMSRKIDNSTPV